MFFLDLVQGGLRLLLLAMMAAISGLAAAQEDRPARAAITPELSHVAAKRLEGVREFLTLEQWAESVAALEGLSADFGDALVEVETGRFLNVHDVCLSTIARLPPEGLAAYRARVDTAAEFLYREAVQHDDPQEMRQLLERHFPSSYGDDALWWLAEDAWAHGDLDRARRYWTQLAPVNAPPAIQPPLLLRYPDADIPRHVILARLVLCSVMQRDFVAARSELRAFRDQYPEESGRLAGRDGLLCEILEDVLLESRDWPGEPSHSGCPTFACRPSRNAVSPSLPTALKPLWQTGLSPSQLRLVDGLRPPSLAREAPGLFPVVWNGIVLIQDDSGVRALNLENGTPAWPSGQPGDRGVVAPPVDMTSVQRPSLGIVRHSATVSGGRYYARVGPPLLAAAAGTLRRIEDRLIALDLHTGEGRLDWAKTAEELLDQEGWRFTGAPLAVEERLYVTMRRADSQVEVSVACLDAVTGDLIWHQAVAIDLDPPPESWHRIGHELLTFADGSVFFSTQAGLLVALNADSGKLIWVAAYPSYPLSPAEMSHPAHAGLLPPVFNRGTLYLAPRDASHVMAFDAATGVLRWRTRKPGRINALLGVAEGLLVAGGDRLWRFSADSGRLHAPFGYDDPAGFGFGRGAIAGTSVYWTTREVLFEVDIASGQALRRIPLELLGVLQGGNLTIADGRLLFAEPDRLTVFSAE